MAAWQAGRPQARTYEGTYSRSPADRFIVKYQPTAAGMDTAIGEPIEAQRDPSRPWIYSATYVPVTPGSYQLNIERTVPGVFGQRWWCQGSAPQGALGSCLGGRAQVSRLDTSAYLRDSVPGEESDSAWPDPLLSSRRARCRGSTLWPPDPAAPE